MPRYTLTTILHFEDGLTEEQYEDSLDDYIEGIEAMVEAPLGEYDSDRLPAHENARITEIYAEED